MSITFPSKMANLGNKRKLAALNKEICEEHPRSILAQSSIVLKSQEDYITQVSEEIERRVTKKLSQEFSKTENRILGALWRLDDFVMNPLIQGHCRTTPETSRNNMALTSERVMMTPGVILILKQASCGARRHETLAQKMATTVSIMQHIVCSIFTSIMF